MAEETDVLFAEINLGKQLKEFWSSPVGRYLNGRAVKSRSEAFESWMSVNPDDHESIRELQFRARLPDLFTQWIDQALNQAKHAEDVLEELD